MSDQELPFEDQDLHGAQALAQEELEDEQETDYRPELEADYEEFRRVQRAHGLDEVVQTAAGRVCWASELSPEEEAAGYRIRKDLAAPDPPF
jgi:hypothetical protein